MCHFSPPPIVPTPTPPLLLVFGEISNPPPPVDYSVLESRRKVEMWLIYIGQIRSHPFMASTKKLLIFWSLSPSPPSAKFNKRSPFRNNRIYKHATNFETSSTPFLCGHHKCMVPNVLNQISAINMCYHNNEATAEKHSEK